MDLLDDLAKEVLVILFRSFPGHFVLIGGGALHWIFNSPRLSVDLDLKPIHTPPPDLLKKMAAVLHQKLKPLEASLGAVISCEIEDEGEAVRVLADGRPVLQIEIVALAPVTGKEKHLLQSDSLQSEIIVTPDIHQLLFAKAVALLKRPQVKGRDVFDIWFLLSRGAVLDAGAFRDWLKWEEKEAEDLQKKLAQITPSRLKIRSFALSSQVLAGVSR
jgi:hypothetical protein